VRIEQVAALLVDTADRRPHIAVGEVAAGDVAPHRVEIALVEPDHALEVARVADIHRIRERGDRGPRLEPPGLEVGRHDVVRVGRGDEALDRQPGALGQEAGGQVAEVAARRREHNRAAGPGAPGLRRGVKVVHRLREQPPDVHRIGRCQPHPPPQIEVSEGVAGQAVTVVEAAGDGVGPHVATLAVEHRQLRFLRRATRPSG
jgi:hypothetical protein